MSAKERPILFGAPMVRALLAGTKTQTRRAVDPTRAPDGDDVRFDAEDGRWYVEGGTWLRRCPYGAVGDRLWVKETYALDDSLDSVRPSEVDSSSCREYLADGAKVARPMSRLDSFDRGKTRVSIHMPRWASRIALEVTEVRAQRLLDISEEDAQTEGLTCLSKDGGRTWKWGVPDRDGLPGNDDDGWHWQEWMLSARDAYAKLWNQINGPASWDANPWVWVVSFKHIAGGAP